MKIVEGYKWKGWPNCILLSNQILDIIATTDIGPRIISFSYAQEENIFLEIDKDLGKTNGSDYRLYGGTRLWHSPEAKPRTYYPDNKKVDYKWDGEGLKLLQEVETTTGMQKEIYIKLDLKTAKAEINYKIYNRNLWPIRFSPWVITLLAKGGRAILPQEPFQSWEDNLLPVRPLVLWSYTKMNDSRFIWGEKYIQIKQDTKPASPLKIGVLNTLGWGVYCKNNYVFIKRYPFIKGEEYPDFNCNTEVYTDANLFELETLGPLKVIEPGSYAEHKENWYLFKEEIGESEDLIDKKLLPLIEKTEIPK